MFTEKVGLGINVKKSAEISHGDLAPLYYMMRLARLGHIWYNLTMRI